jgi:Protein CHLORORESPIRATORY REDUCTION 7
MVDSIMYQEDYFVVLETEQAEQFLTPDELVDKLRSVIQSQQLDLPTELQKFSTLEQQAAYLKDNYCELNGDNGQYLQWYVVRLEK